MRASRAVLAAAALALTAGLPMTGSADATMGMRPLASPRHFASRERAGERHAFEGARRGADRGRHREFGQGDFVGGASGDETAAPQGVEAQTFIAVYPSPPEFYPPAPAFGRYAAVDSGPRIIEIGRRAPRRGPLPVVVYGDFTR